MAGRLYVGTRKGLFVFVRGTSYWQQEAVHFLGEPVTMLLPSAHDGSLYAVLTLGHFGAKLRRLASKSSDWEECAVPEFPAGAEVNAGPPIGDAPPRRKPASLSEIWALETGGRDEPGVLWAGTIPGGLFRSTDAGRSWQLNESLWNRPERWRWFGGGKDDPGIHSICVDPRDSRCVGIGISSGGFWHTSDGGASWECRGQGLRAEYVPPDLANDPVSQDPHRIVACPKDPDTLWMQHHNGIFVTQNRGQQWRELTAALPSPFGFAVAVHPKNPRTAWFVPAADDQCRVPVEGSVVVSRTRDGGESFEVLSRGLPQKDAYDITYRHALDINRAGHTLAFGSTTGGLWLSENQGDDWSCLSHTLPPIYCVRFGAE